MHVFPGYGANDAQGDLKRTWQAICKDAGITDLRFHDLRHSFASFLASSGHNLPLIGKCLDIPTRRRRKDTRICCSTPSESGGACRSGHHRRRKARCRRRVDQQRAAGVSGPVVTAATVLDFLKASWDYTVFKAGEEFYPDCMEVSEHCLRSAMRRQHRSPPAEAEEEASADDRTRL